MNHEITKPLASRAIANSQPHKSICHAIEMKYYLAPLASNQRIPLPRFELNGTYIGNIVILKKIGLTRDSHPWVEGLVCRLLSLRAESGLLSLRPGEAAGVHPPVAS